MRSVSNAPTPDNPVPGSVPSRPRAPGALLLLLEGRAPLEYAASVAATPWLRRLPRGDGHPVLVFPGLGANDLSTAPLRRFLDALGYVTHPWGQGFNFGPRRGVVDRCVDALQALAERHGAAVSLVGWSLGGVYARELAKLHPELVRCVVTLGTPFTGHPRATNAWRFYQFASGHQAHDEALLAQLRLAPDLPTTSIFSRSDGIVAWQCSLNPASPLAENIEVPSSHLGLGLNPMVLYAVADRLGQDPKRWQPFRVSGARRLFFRVRHA